MTITSGKYMARLYDAVRSKSPEGKQLVTFVWDLVGLDTRVSNTVALTDEFGRTDVVASWNVEQWAKGWDRNDLDWFANQIKQGKTINSWVSMTQGAIEYVFPRGEENEVAGEGGRVISTGGAAAKQSLEWCVPPPTAFAAQCNVSLGNECGRRWNAVPTTIKLEVDQEALAQMPDKIEPTFVNAKTLYDAITEKTDREDANLVWTLMAGEIGPMQVDFTPEQWGQMIEKIRKLTSYSFVMKGAR